MFQTHNSEQMRVRCMAEVSVSLILFLVSAAALLRAYKFFYIFFFSSASTKLS